MYTIKGDPNKNMRALQNVSAQGEAGDVYCLGGWAIGNFVPTTDDGRMFGIIGQFNYKDGTSKQVKVNFNSDLKNDLVWQYACEAMVAEKAYDSITVLLAFDHNANQVWFDGIQLVKDEFGESYTYDSDGNVISVQDLRKKNSTYEYASNDLTKAVLPSGAELKYTYDDYHNVKESTSGEGIRSQFSYDSYGNNTSVKVMNSLDPSGSVIGIDAFYTDDGNYLKSVIDVNRDNAAFEYDENKGTARSIREQGDNLVTRTQYKYDDMSRLTEVGKVIGIIANVPGYVAVKYTYDGDNLASVFHSNSLSDGTTYTFSYGSFDLLKTVAVGSHTLFTNSYDTAGKIFNKTRTDYGNGNRAAYTYDANSRLTSVIYDGNNSHKIEYAYDSEDNLGIVTDKRNNLTLRYQYDLSGRLTSIIQNGSSYRKQNFLYDDKNNLKGYDEYVDGEDFNARYYYDQDNRQNHYNIGSVDRYWKYDGYGRTYNILTEYGKKQVLSTTLYHENPLGAAGYVSPRIISWKNETANETRQYDYSYDISGNVSMMRLGDYSTTYRYNNQNQLTRENNQKAGKTWLYTYDMGGNILTKEEYAYTTGNLKDPQKTIKYTYGDSQWKDLLTGYNGKTITSDAVGNMKSDGTWNYTWEHGRQLAGQTKSGTTIAYSYDADGMRLKKTVNGTTYNYAYNGHLLTHMSTSGESVHIRYDSEGTPVHVKYSKTNEEYYYMLNGQGDVVGLVDGNGKLVVEYSYDAWGNPLSISGSMKNTLGKMNPLRYRAYVYDEETGLYYISNRYYNPEMGRFISADTTSVLTMSPTSLNNKNLFAYCDNNPVSRKDVAGGCWITSALITGGLMLAGGVIGAAINVVTSIGIQTWNDGEVNLKSLAVAAGSGFISGAMAASPLSIGWQIGGGAVVGAVSYAVDCKVNDKPVEGDELFFAAVGGGISGAIGGSGANEHLELTKDIMESLDHVAELSLKKVVTCTAKRIIAGNLCQNNKVATAATMICYPHIGQ